ncbi:MAG: peptidylprolyl isomerase [Planctomycetaceae bacterium]|jgi:hypothetical protein|nr:peptidylprolyl isomerase [Planctomycetaceae bacterium]
MTVKSIFYTIAILTSLGTVGAIISNPQIVQQGAILLGLSDKNQNETENNDAEVDMWSHFLKPNDQNSIQPENQNNALSSPYDNTLNPPTLNSTPFPAFPSTTPSTQTNIPSPLAESPTDLLIANQTNTPASFDLPSTSIPYAATAEKSLVNPANPQTSEFNNDKTTTTNNNQNSLPENIDIFNQWSNPIPSTNSTNLDQSQPAVEHSSNFNNINSNPDPSTDESFSSQNITILGQQETKENILKSTNNESKNDNLFSVIDPNSALQNPNPSTETNQVTISNSSAIIPNNDVNLLSPFPTPTPIPPPTSTPTPTLPPTPSTTTPPTSFPVAQLPTETSPSSLSTTSLYSSPTPTPPVLRGSEIAINPSVIAEEISCIGTETVARVGCEVILMCDILPQLRRFGYRVMKENLKSLPPEQREIITEEEKNKMLAKCIEVNYQEFLKMQIEGSLVYNDFLMSMPREQISVYEKRLNEEFDRKDIPTMIKEFGLNNNVELKRFLEEGLGSSLERERMLATRNKLIQMWVARTIQDSDVDLTYEELNDYYKQHLDEFTTKERVQWKEMVVLYSKFKDKQEAWNKINWMLNEVKRGVDFEGLTKLNSDGLTAPEGGVRSWTKRGDISSKIIENVIFEIPVMQISNIIESENSFNIVIVTNREKEKIVPFIDAQTTIKRKIKSERIQKKQTEYLENLKQKYPVIVLKRDFNLNMAKPISRPLK